ncbi:MAG: hypothetical protein AAF217_11030 [Pseudomonadota bacterium]
MLNRGTLIIMGAIGTFLVMLFVLGLAESISSGFAGFWGGLPYWLIAIFVMYLAVYDYLEEACGLDEKWRSLVQTIGIVYFGSIMTLGAWGVSTVYSKHDVTPNDNSTFWDSALPEAIWMIIAFAIATTTVFVLLRRYENQKESDG